MAPGLIISPRCAGGCYRPPKRDLNKALPGAIIRKTWKTPLEKAVEGDPPEYQWLHDIADSLAPTVREKFLAAVAEIRGTVDEAALIAALDAGDFERIMQILGLADQAVGNEGDLFQGMLDPIEHGVHEAGHAAIETTPAIARLGGSVAMRFDLVNPHTVQAVQQHGFNLIRQISDDTRNGVRAIVAHAMEFGGHPYEQARQIKQLVGLTENQVAAVSNYRRLLEAGDSDALTRELRDHRFDPTVRGAIREGVALPKGQVDTMVQRYADRMLAMRAETIARTETINAARLGTQAAWTQAGENGLLSHNKIRQGWMVTPDDRLCQYCSEVPDMNPDGVPLGGQFKTPFGPVDGPTLHPNCRCIVYLMGF